MIYPLTLWSDPHWDANYYMPVQSVDLQSLGMFITQRKPAVMTFEFGRHYLNSVHKRYGGMAKTLVFQRFRNKWIDWSRLNWQYYHCWHSGTVRHLKSMNQASLNACFFDESSAFCILIITFISTVIFSTLLDAQSITENGIFHIKFNFLSYNANSREIDYLLPLCLLSIGRY